MSMAKTARDMIDDINKIKSGKKKLPKNFYDVEEYESDQWLKINGMADRTLADTSVKMWTFADDSALLHEDDAGYNLLHGQGVIDSTINHLFYEGHECNLVKRFDNWKDRL